MIKNETKSYARSLCESYKDFLFVFDTDLGVYVIKSPKDETPEDTVDTVFVNITPENSCDKLDDVIAYVDDYYNATDDNTDDTNNTVDESLTEDSDDSLRQMFGEIFSVVLTRSDDGENESVEFNDIKLAQDYIDDLKRDNDDFFSKAILVDENGKVLDSWEYVNEINRHKSTDDESEAIEPLNEDADTDETTETVETDVVDDVAEADETTIEATLSAESNAITENKYKVVCDAACAANLLLCNMKTLHWNVSGEHFDILHKITQYYAEKASEDLDILAEMTLELGCPVYNPAVMCVSFGKDIINSTDGKMFTSEFVNTSISKNIHNFINALYDINKIEIEPNIVDVVNSMIRFWSKELNYKQVRRQFAN